MVCVCECTHSYHLEVFFLKKIGRLLCAVLLKTRIKPQRPSVCCNRRERIKMGDLRGRFSSSITGFLKFF